MKSTSVCSVIEMPKKKARECYVEIYGQPDGNGPFSWSFNGVSPQLILIMEELLKQLKDELFEIIQGEES